MGLIWRRKIKVENTYKAYFYNGEHWKQNRMERTLLEGQCLEHYPEFIVKHWRFGDKLTRILISSALSHVSPKSIGTIKFNIGRHSLGRGETYNQEWHHGKFRYYPNDIKSWILWTFYEVTTARHDTRKAYNLQLFVVPKLEYYFWQDRQINASQVDVAIIYWVWARV